jgi:hypothetical protein
MPVRPPHSLLYGGTIRVTIYSGEMAGNCLLTSQATLRRRERSAIFIVVCAERTVTTLLAFAWSRTMESAGVRPRGQESVKWHQEQ